MKTHIGAIIVIWGILSGVAPGIETVKDPPMEKFEGTWKAKSFVFDGRNLGAASADEFRCIFRDNEFTFRIADLTTAHGKYRVDEAKRPQTIDLERTDKAQAGKTQLGIYRFEGENLWLCYAAPGKDRPTEFAATSGSGQTLIVLNKLSR